MIFDGRIETTSPRSTFVTCGLDTGYRPLDHRVYLLALSNHHMLGDLIITDRLSGKVLAKARLLETAMRSLRRQRHVIVHPNRTKLQLGGEAHGASDVF